MVCWGASSMIVRLLMASNVGGSLIELTVRRKELLEAAPLVSVAVSVMVAVPKRLVAGSARRMNSPLVPLIERLDGGNKSWSEDTATSEIFVPELSGSTTVNGSDNS